MFDINIIMEHFDQIEGFDQENTSKYSSFNPIPTVSRYASNAYDKIKDTAIDIKNDISDMASTGYYNFKNTINDQDMYNTQNQNLNIQDFYASSPNSTILRDDMNGFNTSANSKTDPLIMFNPTPIFLPTHNQEQEIMKRNDSSILDYNSFLFLILLLVIFLAWKFLVVKH